jgi:hypothetical protein
VHHFGLEANHVVLSVRLPPRDRLGSTERNEARSETLRNERFGLKVGKTTRVRRAESHTRCDLTDGIRGYVAAAHNMCRASMSWVVDLPGWYLTP